MECCVIGLFSDTKYYIINRVFHGVNVRIIKTTEQPAPANEYYPNEKTIGFDIEPADEEAERILGKFYSHGSYGGVGCLELELIKRDSQ